MHIHALLSVALRAVDLALWGWLCGVPELTQGSKVIKVLKYSSLFLISIQVLKSEVLKYFCIQVFKYGRSGYQPSLYTRTIVSGDRKCKLAGRCNLQSRLK